MPVGADGRADVRGRPQAAITPNTAVIVGSAPCFPNGLVDPISELAAARRTAASASTPTPASAGSCCRGPSGSGYDVPPFDFRVPGVTSMSADTHKYGYAAKGTSVVLYRDKELRHHQYYRPPTGPAASTSRPTFAGSRPGALSAGVLGRDGVARRGGLPRRDAPHPRGRAAVKDGHRARSTASRSSAIRCGTSRSRPTDVDVYRVLDVMGHHGWSLNGLQDPPSVHLCVTLRHTQPGVVDRFLADLAQAVETVRADPQAGGSMAPIYGMATMAEMQGTVEELLEGYVDLLFEP